MNLAIWNDIHIGVQRQTGTTPKTQMLLREYLLKQFRDSIGEWIAKDISGSGAIILGDLFDSFWVDPIDLLATYDILSDYLIKTDHSLWLVAGNHDYAPKGDKLSSFELLCRILRARFDTRVNIVDHNTGATVISPGVYAIGHMPNQELFEVELERAAQFPDGLLLLHCNVLNPFAEKRDHSLNLTEKLARCLTEKHHIIVAHEHQNRTINIGNGIEVLGNQWPSSIADCLSKSDAQHDGLKYSHIIHQDLQFEKMISWNRADSFVEMNWRELDDDEWLFIRVTGDAKASEASEVIDMLAKYRSISNAFVISNAVKIEGMAEMDNLAQLSLEEIKGFDVMGALMKELDPDEQIVVQEVMADD